VKKDNVYRITFKIYGDAAVNVTAPSAQEAERIWREEPGTDPRIEGLGHEIRREGAPRIRLNKVETEELHKSTDRSKTT
jgi:hypothetical protein